jgi:hypothetical protein
VWRYTASAPGARLLLRARALSPTVDVELFVRDNVVGADACGGDQLACAATLGNEDLDVQLPLTSDTIVIVVQGFVPRTGGAYALDVLELTQVGEGETCILPAVCGANLVCVADVCRTLDDAFCASTVAVVPDAPVTLRAVGTEAGVCDEVNSVLASSVSVSGTVDGELVVTTNRAASIELRSACGVEDAADQCIDVPAPGGPATFATTAGDVLDLVVATGDGNPIELIARTRARLASGAPCVPSDDSTFCPGAEQCVGLRGSESCQVVTEVPEAGVCLVGNTAAVCVDGTLCLGGPSPRDFTCTNPEVSPTGGFCIDRSTDATCEGVQACINSLCVPPTPSLTHEFSADIVAGQEPTSVGRTRNGCRAQNLDLDQRFAYVVFRFENVSATEANVTAFTTGTGDTTLALYSPGYIDDDVTAGCFLSNDDRAPNTQLSQVEFRLRPGSTGEFVVSGFESTASFPFGLTVTSSVPITALRIFR